MIGSDEKAAGAGRRVLDHLVGLGLHQAHEAVDQGARREVLLSAGLLLGGVRLQQALGEVAEALLARREPVQLVDGRGQGLEVGRLAQLTASFLSVSVHTMRANLQGAPRWAGADVPLPVQTGQAQRLHGRVHRTCPHRKSPTMPAPLTVQPASTSTSTSPASRPTWRLLSAEAESASRPRGRGVGRDANQRVRARYRRWAPEQVLDNEALTDEPRQGVPPAWITRPA
jgi:hypothetical protein